MSLLVHLCDLRWVNQGLSGIYDFSNRITDSVWDAKGMIFFIFNCLGPLISSFKAFEERLTNIGSILVLLNFIEL
jgi:hypothetical protein